MRNEYKILSRELAGKISLGRPKRTQEDNIKIDIEETEMQEFYKNCSVTE
jgi:hypothetical protein